jgi:hypothetical protein
VGLAEGVPEQAGEEEDVLGVELGVVEDVERDHHEGGAEVFLVDADGAMVGHGGYLLG